MSVKTFKISPTDFEDALLKAFNELDCDIFAYLGGELLGGECFYNNEDNTYDFTPNILYSDAFGPPMEEQDEGN